MCAPHCLSLRSCVLLSFAEGVDRQLKLSLFFVIKREYPQGVGDKINSSVAFNRFFILPQKFTRKFLLPLSDGQLFCCCCFACVCFRAHTSVRPYICLFFLSYCHLPKGQTGVSARFCVAGEFSGVLKNIKLFRSVMFFLKMMHL